MDATSNTVKKPVKEEVDRRDRPIPMIGRVAEARD